MCLHYTEKQPKLLAREREREIRGESIVEKQVKMKNHGRNERRFILEEAKSLI
jgi:hypothetical protein